MFNSVPKTRKGALIVLFFALLPTLNNLLGQTIAPERLVQWKNAGLEKPVVFPARMENVMNYGASNDSTGNSHPAIVRAVAALAGQPGVVFFPKGTYVLKSTLTLPSGVVIRGDAAEKTALVFDLPFGGDCISIYGSPDTLISHPVTNAAHGSNFIKVDSVNRIQAGTWIQIKQKNKWDTDPPTSWAQNSPGQIVRVNSIGHDSLFLSEPLLLNVTLADSAQIVKLNMKENVGIENLRITRLTGLNSGGANIDFRYAANCWVKGIESRFSVSAHIFVNQSAHLLVSGNYINEAFVFDGSNTRGLGVMLITQTTACLIENNIFRYLRHHIIMKQGAAGNVAGYNFTTEPHRTETPSDYGGDMVLHGFYATANLFEGNIGMYGQITETWGPSGPLNTFFRNRFTTYGLASNKVIYGSDTLQTDSLSVVANEITGSGSNYGISLGLLRFYGYGHFVYGNSVGGQIYPATTANISVPEKSLYRITQPDWWGNADPFGGIGYPNTYYINKNPALRRWERNESLVVPADTQTGMGPACPPATVTALGNSLINQGDSVALKSSVLKGNLWNTGDTTAIIWVKQSGTYWLRYRNGNCRSVVSNQLAITVKQAFVTLNGRIKTPSGLPVPGVHIKTDSNPVILSDTGGHWTKVFTGGDSVQVSVWKTDDTARQNGLSTYDLVSIQRHLQGQGKTLGTYQIIAGDVDKNRQLNGADISQIRDFILGNINDFQGKNWAFPRSNYIIRSIHNPFGYDTIRQYSHLYNSLSDQDFVALRLGDVNGSWNVPYSQQTNAIKKIAGLASQTVLPGAFVQLPVYSLGFDTVAGFQFTMAFNPAKLQFLGISAGVLSNVNVNSIVAGRGKIGIQWDEPTTLGVQYPDSQILFYVNFAIDPAFTNGRTPIIINSSLMPSEVINGKGKLFTQALDTGYIGIYPLGVMLQKVQHDGLKASPNPFSISTQFEFWAETDEAIRFRLINILGQVVFASEIKGKAGQDRFLLENTGLGQGLFWAEVEGKNWIKRCLVECK